MCRCRGWRSSQSCSCASRRRGGRHDSHDGGMTVVSFLNLNKYPPSLLFLLMTLGPVLLALRALDAHTPRALRPAQVIGEVPMFYYMMHILLLHLVAVAASLARYGTARPAMESPTLDRFPMTQVPGWPAPLPA